MIASIRGRLARKEDGRAVLEAAGVGYLLQISTRTALALPSVGDEAFLHVHTHVREDALQLFGFSTELELTLFEKLISVSGVGPKLAVAALSGLSAEELVAAITRGEIPRLSSISGIGKKTAERIVLELRDKLLGLAVLPAGSARPGAGGRDSDDVVSALLNLGYRRRDVEQAVAKAEKGAAPGFEALLKSALALLAPRSAS